MSGQGIDSSTPEMDGSWRIDAVIMVVTRRCFS